MKRLNSLVLLSAGIAAGAAGNYWLTNRPEPVSTPAAAEQSHSAPGDRKNSLLSQSDGPSGHLAGAEEGLDGHGLHPGICARN